MAGAGPVFPGLIHRHQPLWIEDSFMHVQAAHNLAAMHYAREARLKTATDKGQGSGGNNGASGAHSGVQKWTTAHPMASVRGVLMQSVEPLEDFLTGVTDLIPMPNPNAPSANEVKMALQRRRLLDRERGQQQQQQQQLQQELLPGPPGQVHPELGDGQDEDLGISLPSSPVDNATTNRVGRLVEQEEDDGEDDSVPDLATMRKPSLRAVAPMADAELTAEPSSQDNRLVLPVLESLIALRRSRLVRTVPSAAQPQQQPYPPTQRAMSIGGGGGGPGGGTASGADGVWQGSTPQSTAIAAAAAATKGAGAKQLRRGGLATSSGPAASYSAAQLRLSVPDDGGGAGDGPQRSSVSFGAAALKPQMSSSDAPAPPPLSQFPGPWRASRKWEVITPDMAALMPPLPLPAGAVPGPAGAVPGPAGVAPPCAGPTGRTPGSSWAGNEPAVPFTSFAAALIAAGGTGGLAPAAKPGAQSPPPPQPPQQPPQQPAAAPAKPGAAASARSPAAAAAAATAVGPLAADASAAALAYRTSPLSPRTSADFGRISGCDEPQEQQPQQAPRGDSVAMARNVARQRAILQEWQEWRDRGGLGPPPGIDEETGSSDNGDGASDDDSDGDDDDSDGDDDGHGLLLGIPSRKPAKVPGPPQPPLPRTAGTAPPAASASAPAAPTDDDGGPAASRATWRRARRITQSFDVTELVGAAAAAAAGSMPRGIISPQNGSSASQVNGPGSPPRSAPAVAQMQTCLSAPIPTSGLTGGGPLSPMASRRGGQRNDSLGGGGKPGVGSLGLSTWLSKAFGGGAAVAAAAAAAEAAIAEQQQEDRSRHDGGGGGGGGSSTSPGGGGAAVAMTRVPSLTAAKHLSFTSKFNRFKARIQTFSHVTAPPVSEGAWERTGPASPSSVQGGGPGSPLPAPGTVPRVRLGTSNDGRNGPESPLPSQFVVRQPAGRKAAAEGALPRSAAGSLPDATASGSRPPARTSMESAFGVRVQQQQAQAQQQQGSRQRVSLDARLPGQQQQQQQQTPFQTRGRQGGDTAGLQLQEGVGVMGGTGDRNRRGEGAGAAGQGALPPVRG